MRRGRGVAVVAATVAIAWLSLAPAAGAKQFGYLSGFLDGDIAGGRLLGADGFGELPGSPYATGSTEAQGIATSPDGKHVFLVDAADALRAFNVDENGSLSQAAGSPQPTGRAPYGVATTPDGKYVFASSADDQLIAGFKIAPRGGISPTAQGTVANPGGPRGIAIDPKGKHLFSANADGTVSSFIIANNGGLAEIPGSPFGAVESPFAVAVSPNGKTVYVANRDNPSGVHAFAVSSGGSLTELAGSPRSTGGDNAFSLAVSPDGRNVYAGNYESDTLAGFAVQPGGRLTALPGSPYPSTEAPAAITFDASGGRLFLNAGTGPLQTWDIGGDGVPTNPVFNLFGAIGDFQSIALTPAQPPNAKLKAKRKRMKVKLNASRSRDDGSIIEYAWKFGDGTKTATMGPKVTHKYASKGRYRVKVTLTDDDNCSTKLIAAGQTAYCNGSKQAIATKKVKIK